MRAADLPLILGAADADRGIGPRDRERARKAARTDNRRAAAVSITASSRAADLWRAGRTGVEGGGDWWRGLGACASLPPGQRRDNEEPDKSSPPMHRVPPKCRPDERHEVHQFAQSAKSLRVVFPDHGQLIS